MFACLHSLSAPSSLLMKVAQDFTPRYEVIGPLVMLDVSGLSRLFGSAREIGEQLRASMSGAPVRIAIASSQTAAALLALGRPGLTVVRVDEQPAALARLQVSLLGELEKTRSSAVSPRVERPQRGALPPNIAEMEDVLPYFQSCLDRTSEAARAPHASAAARVTSHASSGWTHPRDAHAVKFATRVRNAPAAPAHRTAPHLAHPAHLPHLLLLTIY